MLVVFTIEPLVAVTVTKPFKAGAAATVRFSAKLKVFGLIQRARRQYLMSR
jgi:hypothetical protein